MMTQMPKSQRLVSAFFTAHGSGDTNGNTLSTVCKNTGFGNSQSDSTSTLGIEPLVHVMD